MANSIILPVGTSHISVANAFSEILTRADFPETVDICLEVLKDENGNEYCPEDGVFVVGKSDGKGLGAREIKANFLSFCDKTGTKPSNPYARFVPNYDGTNESHDVLYQITIDELREFALSYGVAVAVQESPLSTPALAVSDEVQRLIDSKAGTNPKAGREDGKPDEKSKPLQRQQHQEQEILRVIEELGYQAKAIPKAASGKRGVKHEVRIHLDFGMRVFDKAWERLRAQCSGLICTDTSIGGKSTTRGIANEKAT